MTHKGLAVFISHSGKDAELAEALIDLLKSALAIRAEQIRCSSVDGYRLPVGVNTEGKLREEVNAATVVVGLVTPNSLKSAYVMFELGARWGANRFLAPLLAGVQAHDLSGPLSLLNGLSASNDAQIHQLIGDVGRHLQLERQPPETYLRHVAQVKRLADAAAQPSTPDAVASAQSVNKGFDAKEYWARKNCVLERFPNLSHGAKEALHFFGLFGRSTAQNITDRLLKNRFPDAQQVVDNLRNDSVPFIVSAGLSEYELNPELAQIIKETIGEDEKRLIDEVHPMSADAFKNRIINDPGYAARYSSISDRRKPINSYNKLITES